MTRYPSDFGPAVPIRLSILQLAHLRGIGTFRRWMPWVLFPLPSLFVLGYPIWVRRATSGWSQSAHRLSLRQSIANQAQHNTGPFLWFFFIGSLVFVAGGLWLIAVHKWYVGVASISFFGFGAVLFLRMLVIQGQTSICES